MSLFAPRTSGEAKFQHCNYGYDTSKYKSFDDCMANYDKFNKSNLPDKLPILNNNKPETFTNLKCNDGSIQSVGSNPLGGRVDVPCRNNGGVSPNQDLQKPRTFIEMNQGYIIIAVVLVAGYFAYKKFKK
jgi:hypothetical protein